MSSLFKKVKGFLKDKPQPTRAELNKEIGGKNLENDLTFVEKFRVRIGSVQALKDRLLEDKLLNEAEKKVLPSQKKEEIKAVAQELVDTLKALRKNNQVVNLTNAGTQMIQKRKDEGATPEQVAEFKKQVISLYPPNARKAITKEIDKKLARIEVAQQVSELRNLQVDHLSNIDLTISDKGKFYKDPGQPGFDSYQAWGDMNSQIAVAALNDISNQGGIQEIADRALFYLDVAKQCIAENDFNSPVMLRQAVTEACYCLPKDSPQRNAIQQALDRDENLFKEIKSPQKHTKACEELSKNGTPVIPNMIAVSAMILAVQQNENNKVDQKEKALKELQEQEQKGSIPELREAVQEATKELETAKKQRTDNLGKITNNSLSTAKDHANEHQPQSLSGKFSERVKSTMGVDAMEAMNALKTTIRAKVGVKEPKKIVKTPAKQEVKEETKQEVKEETKKEAKEEANKEVEETKQEIDDIEIELELGESQRNSVTFAFDKETIKPVQAKEQTSLVTPDEPEAKQGNKLR